jgi:hypothetical protein
MPAAEDAHEKRPVVYSRHFSTSVNETCGSLSPIKATTGQLTSGPG